MAPTAIPNSKSFGYRLGRGFLKANSKPSIRFKILSAASYPAANLHACDALVKNRARKR
jgi:hypothetical protein